MGLVNLLNEEAEE